MPMVASAYIPSPPQPPPKVDGETVAVAARKDRHSKICTAGGMRDRRMRLSLDVARRFFALQDKLGFDKASKTVQWLLDMSRAGIKELMISEDGSGLSDATKKHDEQQITMDSDRKKKKRPIKALIKRAAARKATRKLSQASSSSISAIDKESRARARERARERTKERNRLRWATLASSISIDEAPSGHLDMASQVEDAIPSLEHSSYHHQDQWELSGVVFAKARTLPLIE